MRKLIFSTMAIMLIASSVAFAQKTRTLGVYFDATAGNVNQSDGKGGFSADGTTHYNTASQKLFAGNEFEFGVFYKQNFETVQWLTFQLKALVVTTQNGLYEPDETTLDGLATTTKPGKYKGLDLDGGWWNNAVAGSPRAQIGLMLNSAALGFDGLYVGVYFDTRTLGVFETMYTLGLGNAGGLTFGAIVEFWANPQVVSAQNSAGDTKYAYNVLDVFEIRVAYNIPFAEIWSFNTQLGFRFQGAGGDADSVIGATPDLSYHDIKTWEENFVSRLQIRWENQINVNAGGLGLWARVRYNLNNLGAAKIEYKNYINNGSGTGLYTEKDLVHEVVLQAGISYSFDLSAL